MTENTISNIPAPTAEELTPVTKVLRNLREVLVPHFGPRETHSLIRIIFEYVKGWDPVDLIINENKPLSAFVVRQIRDIVARLLNDEPIQYIVGNAHFYGIDFKVGPGVLVPRPETAELVELVVAGAKNRADLRVLDLGAGSGCISIALSRNLPFSQVTAVDNSPTAIKYIKENADKLHARINIVEADIFSFEPAPESLDIIVSNPPYVDEAEKADMNRNVLEYEPAEALFVPDSDPLVYYRRIADIGWEALADGGRIYFEINPRHSDAMLVLMAGKGYDDVAISLDVHGRRRFLSATRPARQS